MLIASKLEEISPPSADDLVYISDHTYTRNEILHMESIILQKLEFRLSAATSADFLRRYLLLRGRREGGGGGVDEHMAHLADYLIELALQVGLQLADRPTQPSNQPPNSITNSPTDTQRTPHEPHYSNE